MVAGADPTAYGVPFSASTYDYVRRCLERGEWRPHEDSGLLWQDIEDHADPDDAPSPEAAFFEWRRGTDLERLVEAIERPLADGVVRAVARNVPRDGYASLYPVYDFATKRV